MCDLFSKVYFQKTEKLDNRAQSAAAHGLLKRVLSEKFALDESEISVKKTALGAPFVDFAADVFVSLSHTDGLVACAVGESEIGVDAEVLMLRRKSVEKRVFTEAEISLLDAAKDENKAFFTLWTLKEAYLKAIGTGFMQNAKSVEFLSLEPNIISDKKEYRFASQVVDGYVISVCEKKQN